MINLVNVLEHNPKEVEDEIIANTIIEMDKIIVQLQEDLIKAKARALPDDFFSGDKRITYSIEEK